MVKNIVKWVLFVVVLGLAYWDVQLLVRGVIWTFILSLALAGIEQFVRFAKERKNNG